MRFLTFDFMLLWIQQKYLSDNLLPNNSTEVSVRKQDTNYRQTTQ
jgi:hypothetical protein